MSGGGGSKPDPVKASQGEKDQAALAKQQINYYRSTYAPLEKEYAKEAGADYSDRFAGQASSAAAREMTGTLQNAVRGSQMVDTAAMGSDMTLGRMAGTSQGKRLAADGKLDALSVGLGATADASRSLSEAGQIQTQAALDAQRERLVEMEGKYQQRNAMVGAAGSLIGAAGSYYAMGQMGANTPGLRESLTSSKGALTARYGSNNVPFYAGVFGGQGGGNVRATARGGRR